MDDFGSLTTTDTAVDTTDALGGAYEASPLGCEGPDGYPDWSSVLLNELYGIGTLYVVDYERDGVADFLTIDSDNDGKPDIAIVNNHDGTYVVLTGPDEGGTWRFSTTMTAEQMQEFAPGLWAAADSYCPSGPAPDHGHHGHGSHGDSWVEVQPGDSLWKLAERYYGDGSRWPEIYTANPWIDDPNLIYPGDWLEIPAHSHGHHGHHDHGQVYPEYSQYTVEPGDSLWKIAANELGDPNRWPEIAEVNPWLANPNLIYPGQQLSLPSNGC